MKISIAMATYNGARFVREQLDSFAQQTRLPDELVVTDDCSTDSTLDIVEDFRKNAPFDVRIHRNPENLGLTRNFEKVLFLCSGDIIFLSDQDDVWFPEKLETIERHFQSNPSAQVLINDALLADAALHHNGNTQRGNILRAGQSEKWFFTGCCSAHRKSWHELALPIPHSIPAHDLWLNCLAIEVGCARQVPDLLQIFRRHGGNSSDWALSDPKGLGFWSALRLSGLHDARPGWRSRANLLREFLRRLNERSKLASTYSWDLRSAAIERELANIERRIDLCSLPRSRRALGVARFWIEGGYRAAAGWKSAAKDLIRP